eukprot:Gb_06528 [translate_table: standard]
MHWSQGILGIDSSKLSAANISNIERIVGLGQGCTVIRMAFEAGPVAKLAWWCFWWEQRPETSTTRKGCLPFRSSS